MLPDLVLSNSQHLLCSTDSVSQGLIGSVHAISSSSLKEHPSMNNTVHRINIGKAGIYVQAVRKPTNRTSLILAAFTSKGVKTAGFCRFDSLAYSCHTTRWQLEILRQSPHLQPGA